MPPSNGTPRKPKTPLPDQDDPEYLRSLRRPAVIKEDLWEMERRRRVQQVLAAKDFRDELEDVVQVVQVSGGVGIRSSHSTADMHRDASSGERRILHQIAQLLNGNAAGAPAAMAGISTSLTNLHLQQPQQCGGAVIPICDFSALAATPYSKQERVYRCKLASLYRLVDLFHWSQGIYNHITVGGVWSDCHRTMDLLRLVFS
jgi:adducin